MNIKQLNQKDFETSDRKQPSLLRPKNKLTFMQAMVDLYHATLDLNDFKEVHTVPELSDFCKFLYTELGGNPDLVKVDRILIPPTWKEDKDCIIHGFTGGKDSLSTLLKFEKDFKRSIAFHVRSVNRSYPLEHLKAKALVNEYTQSEYIEVKAMFPQVKHTSESPIKTLMIMVLACEVTGVVPKWFTLGGANIFDISETTVFGDTSKAIYPFMDAFNNITKASMGQTPWLETQTEAYDIIHAHGIPFSALSSCMTSERFKKMQRDYTVNKYTKMVEGKTLITGTVKATGKSIHDLLDSELKELKLSDLDKVDIIEEHDYRCLKCFKCNEKALVFNTRFEFDYPKGYIDDARRLIINWMDKSPNLNKVDLTRYFEDVLYMPIDTIDSKYHPYIKGEQERPDGWTPPKVKPKKTKNGGDVTEEEEDETLLS